MGDLSWTREEFEFQGTPVPQVQDPLTAVVHIGFDPEIPYRRELAWIPITVELTNHQKDLTGDLIVRLKNGSVTYRVPVALPAKTKKSYSFLTHVPENLDELEFYVQAGRSQIPFQVVTTTTSYMENNRFLAIMSPERGAHDHFAHRPEEEVDIFRRVVYTMPAMLPAHWVGYQNIDVLMWDGGPAAVLTAEQSQALETWIQMGGTLVLAAGEHWQELNTSSFRSYLPFPLSGSRATAPGMELVSDGEKARPKLSAGLVIATGEIRNDPHNKIWLKAGNDPFLVERKWGAGRILFFASGLRVPLFDDPVHQELVKDFISDAPSLPSPKTTIQLDSIISTFLRWQVQAELPSTWFIAGYLGCYILLVVPINYLVFRKLRRLEWAWFTVPIWAFLFAYGAYYIGALRQQGSVTVNEISVVEACPGAAVAPTTTYCSIYSPVRQWYTIHFDNPPAFPSLPFQTLLSRGSREGTVDESLTVSFPDNGVSVEEYLIYHWSQRLLKAQHSTPLREGVEINLKGEGEQVSGTITNRSGFALQNPVIYLRDRRLDVKDLRDGESVRIDGTQTVPFDADQVAGELYSMANPYAPSSRNPSILIRDSLKRLYAAAMYCQPLPQGLAVLIAQTDRPLLPFTLNRQNPKPQGSTLFCVVFPFKQTLRGRHTLPDGVWKFSLPVLGGGQAPYPSIPGLINPRSMESRSPITIFMRSDYSWNLTTDIPLLGGKIEDFYLRMSYDKIMASVFPEPFDPRRLGPRGMFPGRGMPPPESETTGGRPRVQGGMFPGRGMQQPLVALENGKPADPQYELRVKNRISQQYEPLSAITDVKYRVSHPDRYVDKVAGTISVKMKAPDNQNLIIPPTALTVGMTIRFDSESGETFLGRPLGSESEEPNRRGNNDSH